MVIYAFSTSLRPAFPVEGSCLQDTRVKGVEPIGRLLDHVCQTCFALAFASLKNALSPRTLRAWLPQKTLKSIPVTFLSRDPLTVNYLTQKDCIAYYARTMERSLIAYEHAPHIRNN